MSYILDALKKSDQERQSRQSPTIQTVHRPARIRKRPLFWIVALVSLVLIVGIGAAVLMWVYGARTVAVVDAAPASPSPNQAITTEVSPQPEQPVAAETTQAAAPSNGAGSPTVAFSDLPDHIRNEIPALTFSFHVFSETPSSRTIIINNRRVKEGDSVLQNLQLIEITRDGVVLDWKGRRFYINVVDNW